MVDLFFTITFFFEKPKTKQPALREMLRHFQVLFNNYSPKAQLILLNNPRDEVEGIIQQY